MKIKEHRLLAINNKVFSTENILELAQILWGEYMEEKEGDIENSVFTGISFSVKCNDRTLFESEYISIFEKESVIHKKKVISITMIFQKGKEKLIKIYLEHGSRKEGSNYDNTSDIEIGGNNPFWVSGISDKISVLIDSIPSQESYYFKYEKIFNGLFALIAILSITTLVDYVNSGTKDYTPYLQRIFKFEFLSSFERAFKYIFFLSIAGFMGWAFFAQTVTEKVYKLWPIVELQIGPEHLQIEKRKRWFFFQLFTLILIPLILSIIIEIVF